MGSGALMWWFGSERDRRNKVAHLRWAILLAASLVASTFMLRVGLGRDAVLKWAIVALPIALLVPWLLAYLRFLREADELVRKIQLEGVAVGFWVGMSFGIVYMVLEAARLPRLDPPGVVAIMLTVMALGYVVGRIRASKRYR